MITRQKKEVTLESGKKYTVDLARASSPAARLGLYKNDRHGDPLGLLTFLEYALGMEQLEDLIASIGTPDDPGNDAALMEVVREIFQKLGDDGKKS